MDRIENNAPNNSSIAACVFVAMAILLSHCLAMRGEYTYRHTNCWKGFMKYTVEMGSRAMIVIPSFVQTGSAIQKLMGGIQRQHGDRIRLLLFFQNKEHMLKVSNLI
jgi:hypothetical protein